MIDGPSQPRDGGGPRIAARHEEVAHEEYRQPEYENSQTHATFYILLAHRRHIAEKRQ
jgi:hypothetical protein